MDGDELVVEVFDVVVEYVVVDFKDEILVALVVLLILVVLDVTLGGRLRLG